jgi:hypothetical protein
LQLNIKRYIFNKIGWSVDCWEAHLCQHVQEASSREGPTATEAVELREESSTDDRPFHTQFPLEGVCSSSAGVIPMIINFKFFWGKTIIHCHSSEDAHSFIEPNESNFQFLYTLMNIFKVHRTCHQSKPWLLGLLHNQ